MSDKPVEKPRPLVNTRMGVRRNGRCLFCVSGKKFKHCHGAPVRGETLIVTAAGEASERPVSFECTLVRAVGPRPTRLK